MENKRKFALPGLALAAVTAVLAVLPLEKLLELGPWLRELSLSGGRGNAAAWAVVLGLTALPALGLLWRGRCWWDLLLLLAAGEIFIGLYFLVNPTLLHALVPGESAGMFWGLAAAGSAGSAVLAWAVLRGLGRLDRVQSLGRTLQRLLTWSAVLIGWLASWKQGAGLLEKIHAAAEANTAPNVDLGPTNVVLCLLAAADLVPMLLGCAVLLWGGELAPALEADPFGGDTVALAERLSRRCGAVAAVSVLLCAGGNLLQMLLFSRLYSTRFTVSFPVSTVLLAAAFRLLCRYFRRAKAVSDDNDSII